jgi:hypothetical protein
MVKERERFQTCAALAIGAFLGWFAPAPAQPTYKLDVKPHLKPLATLSLKNAKLIRTAVKDDPGFRLQYHFRQGGKTVATVEGRSNATLAIPQKEAGIYTVVLELFYPAYKGGTQQKGEFKPVSNVIRFQVLAGAKPKDPVKVVLVEPPMPVAGKAALVIQCGKGSGKNQEELVSKGYGYSLLQGSSFDGWAKTAGKTHAWVDAKEVRFEVAVLPGTEGTLRLFFVDGDSRKRKLRVTVQGKARGDIEGFGATGKKWEVKLTAADTKSGKVEVMVQTLNPAANAVLSTLEFIPAPTEPRKGK